MKHVWKRVLQLKRHRRFFLIGSCLAVLVGIGLFSLGDATLRFLSSHSIPAPTGTPRIAIARLSLQQETATSAAVILDTGPRAVTAVQVAISFDPKIVRDMRMTPGAFLHHYRSLFSLDKTNGSIFFAMLMRPGSQPTQGKGIVAWLSYIFTPDARHSTTLRFLPTTKVATTGIDYSVLKEATGLTIHLASNGQD